MPHAVHKYFSHKISGSSFRSKSCWARIANNILAAGKVQISFSDYFKSGFPSSPPGNGRPLFRLAIK